MPKAMHVTAAAAGTMLRHHRHHGPAALARRAADHALAALAAAGVIATVGHFLFIRALQMAPASGLASISYAQLAFAALIGYFLFGTFPDHWATAGMLVIAASGLVLTWYGRRRAVVPMGEPAAVD